MILLSIKSQIRNQVEFCLFDSLGWLVLVSRFTILSYFFTVKGKRSQIRIVGVLSRITLVLTLTLLFLEQEISVFLEGVFAKYSAFLSSGSPSSLLSFYYLSFLSSLSLMGINCLIFYLIVF